MEKVHKSSVHSLLNPTSNEIPKSYNGHTSPLVNSSFFENEKTQLSKNKRKRINLYGVELDVPIDIPEHLILNSLQEQLTLFSDSIMAQNAPIHCYSQQQQFNQTPNQFYVFDTYSQETNRDRYSDTPMQKNSSPPHNHFYAKPDATHVASASTFDNQIALELPPIKTDLSSQENGSHSVLPNYSTPLAMPSLDFQTEGDEEEFSSVFLSALKNGTHPLEPAAKVQRVPPPQPDVTYIGPHGHKIKVTKIQPSAKDPPIEVKLIVDDPKTNPFTQQWMEHFGELKKFKDEFGHTNVTRSIAGYYNLGNWVAEQRRKFKQGKITETQFNCLNDIGMIIISQ